MSTYSDAVKVARAQAVLDAIGAAGKIEIGDAGFANVLATVPLNDPPGTVDGVGVISLDVPVVDPSIAMTGEAAEARIRDGSNADIRTGLTVGTSGAEVVVNDVNFVAAGTFTITVGTITPA